MQCDQVRPSAGDIDEEELLPTAVLDSKPALRTCTQIRSQYASQVDISANDLTWLMTNTARLKVSASHFSCVDILNKKAVR
jgi:hypothetical protein